MTGGPAAASVSGGGVPRAAASGGPAGTINRDDVTPETLARLAAERRAWLATLGLAWMCDDPPVPPP